MLSLRPLIVPVALGCLVSGTAPPVHDAPSTQQATFRTRTDVVTVNVSVKSGRRPVTDLTAADFVLTDNGVEQAVDVLSPGAVPIDLTLALVGYEWGPADRRAAYARAVTSASTVRQSLLPPDRLRLVRVHLDIRGGLVSRDESLPVWEMDPESSKGMSLVSMVDGLFYALAWPVEPDRRHLVLAFTDVLDEYSRIEIEMLPRLAAQSDAVLHVVLWGEPPTAPVPRQGSFGPSWSNNPVVFAAQLEQWEARREIVSEAARRTGGAVHRMSSAERDLAAVIEDFRMSYVLQYTPRGVPAAGWHEIGVRVTRAGRLDVRARKGYEIREVKGGERDQGREEGPTAKR